MSFNKIQRLPSPEEIKSEIFLSQNSIRIKNERDVEIKKIFSGESNKFILIIGPCSASHDKAVCEYVSRLAKIQEEVKDNILIIPRIYTNKPRTTGEGYKGMLHQPNPNKAPDMVDGIRTIRKMHVKVISESGLSSADEMLYPDNLDYVEDMLSYIAVGARSVENQQHRLVSSGIETPVGMKNPTCGDLSIMFNSIHAAQHGHNFTYQGFEVETGGNPYSHAILRGLLNSHGESIPNYHYEDLSRTVQLYNERNFQNPAIIVDVNHANSRKMFFEQPRIAREVMYSRKYNPDIKKAVKGLMIESYIEEGSQDVHGTVYGKSITDACLGFEDSKKLIYYIAENL